jgi:hypothetical protein
MKGHEMAEMGESLGDRLYNLQLFVEQAEDEMSGSNWPAVESELELAISECQHMLKIIKEFQKD